MASPDKALKNAKAIAIALGVMTLLYVANYAAVQMGWRPFLYCGLRPVGFAILGWLQLANLVMLAWFAISFYRKKFDQILLSSVAVVITFGLPQYVDTLLRLGGSCG